MSSLLDLPASSLTTGGVTDPLVKHLLPLLARATAIDILAAFVQESGLRVLEHPLFDALARGATLRILTGDYLHITQATALAALLDWSGGNAALAEDGTPRGTLQARVVEVKKLPAGSRSFHPKSWRLEGPGFGVAFVGSSNVSRSALGAGIEWNLRADRERDPAAYQAIQEAFEHWWARAEPLTAEWVQDYARRAQKAWVELPPGEEDAEPIEPPPPPHELQLEALAALEKSREANGRRRALVVLATGLGKTYLAALDVVAWVRAHGHLPRVLMLAHREELLFQAAKTFRRVLGDHTPRFGWYAGERAELDGDLVFASVQKLSRPEHLQRLTPGGFEYVIVDEVHHGTTPTYRSILDRLEPGFLLGLTATPERADGADVAGVFDDHVAYRADLGVGIEKKLLVPFAYYGLRDPVNYGSIPFRGRRFEPEALERAVDTDERFEQAFQAWQEHPATRTLVFCCSIAHAEHISGLLKDKGVRAVAVHSGPESVARGDALDDFAQGKLDALCTVDLFNEGIDLPAVDRVVMLRPTESPVIFLQQLGRGLRIAKGKERLTILDFVGNHRIFLDRVRTLLSLGQAPADLRGFLTEAHLAHLPPGCSLELELEAKDLLKSFLPARGKSEVERVYRDLKAVRGTRPAAGELFRMGYRPSTLQPAHEGWFDFVAAEGDLGPSELRALAAGRRWFCALESSTRPPRLAMIALEALLEAGALLEGLTVEDLTRRMLRSPDLEALEADLVAPLISWSKRFVRDGERVVSRLPYPQGDEAAFVAMTRELVDYWLARDRLRRRNDEGGASFVAKVLLREQEPVLKLPSRRTYPDLPSGDTDVRLPSGEPWRFRFMKEACDVAHPVGVHHNALPDLLRGWFGLAPGTGAHVRFSRSPDGLWVEPDSFDTVSELPRGLLLAFPTLRAAAGAPSASVEMSPEAGSVRLPVSARPEGLFAVRASGDSMDGGRRPIRDGDWLVMRFARGASRDELAGKIALLQVPDPDAGFGYQVKRVVHEGDRWLLRAENPAVPTLEAGVDTIPIAVLVEVVRPEELAPPPGEKLDDAQVAAAFGLEAPPRTGRVDGHMFFCVEAKGVLVAPDRLKVAVDDRRPGETAFVLTRPPGEAMWRYAGVARYDEAEGRWVCPAVDYPTYRALGAGRSSSRALPRDAIERARAIADELVRRHKGAIVEANDRRCRIVGHAKNGGLRVDTGDSGKLRERTVSLTDLGWVLVAGDDVRANGGILNEERVNRVRYIDETPKGSTRYIDSPWALMLVAVAADGAGKG